jgi:hypothetical protein
MKDRLCAMAIPKEMFGTVLSILSVGMLCSMTTFGQSATVEPGNFDIEIHTTGEGSPNYRVTNHTGKTVTACMFELGYWSKSTGKAIIAWDAILQNLPPIEPDASISQYLSHAVGGPLPDKVEVIAGLWADGETFGQTEFINHLLRVRATRVAEYEKAAKILRQGLDENWTTDQYLKAFGEKPDSAPAFKVRSTLSASPQSAQKPKLLRHVVQMLSESFVEKANQLRNAKPATDPS